MSRGSILATLEELPSQALSPLLRLAVRSLGVPTAALFFRDGDTLKLRAGTGLPDQLQENSKLPYFLPPEHSTTPRFGVGDTSTHPVTREAKILNELGWKALVMLQFGIDGGVTAVLCVADHQPREWSNHDLDVLTDIAALIVMQIRRELRVREETVRQRVIEEARRHTEERYRRLFESSRDSIYMTTHDGRFADANSSMLDMFGYTRRELLGRPAADLYINPLDHTHFLEEVAKLGSVRQHEVKLRRQDGSEIECLVSATVQKSSDGTIVGYEGIIHDITERKRSERQLAHNAFHDSLTALPNRALFVDRLERLVRLAQRRPNYRFGVLFLDLDRFKIINDTFGHVVGDKLLSAVARRLEGCLRLEDSVARIGGDEFAIIADSIRDAGDATRVAERVIAELSLPFTIEGHDLQTGTSIGIALSYSGSETAESLLREADAAMYRAKSSGRGRYEVFDPQLHTQAVTQLQIEADLRQALQAGEFALVYQPIMDLRENRVAGFEAFVRWHHPTRGMLLPSDFIPVAEQTGLILQIGWWVLGEASRQMHRWQTELADDINDVTLSVNFSRKQFYQPDLITHIDRIIAEGNASPGRIKIEVGEQVIMQNAESSIKILGQLRQRGIGLSIDDFGTGYSSLSYLQQFPIATLKIDRVFVSALAETGKSGLINSILALARSLNVDALAEGVETAEQVEQLRELGIRYAQGYFFSPPVPADEAAHFITAGSLT